MASAHQHTHQYSHHPPPPLQNQNDFRLPPIKDLNIFKDRGPPPNGPPQSEHGSVAGSGRHESAWSRSASSVSGPPSQHATPMPPPADPPRPTQYPSHKVEGPYTSSGMPLSSHVAPGVANGNGNTRTDAAPQNSLKRGRSDSTLSVSPGRSPHTSYPAYSSHAPPPPFHSVSGGPHAPPSHEAMQPPYPHAGAGYAPYHPPHMPQRHYPVPAPPQAPPPSSAYSQHAPPEHWQHAQHAQHGVPPHLQPPAQYEGYPRTTPLVPANVETRGGPAQAEGGRPDPRQATIAEIIERCKVLSDFANRFVAQGNMPQVQPSPNELQEMARHASTVVRLLEDLRRLNSPEDHNNREDQFGVTANAEEHRLPKRPWEDMSRGETGPAPGPSHNGDYADDKLQSTAEQDMEIIRSKRATSTGGNAPGQPKSKYRKRSRATPPGKCHSCNIRETPEWRRGPDGARTLCNACGLHYAKLMRKRDKAMGADGKPVVIDLQTLRASTASARGADPGDSPQHVHHHHAGGLIPPTYEHTRQPPVHPPHPHHQAHPPPPHQGMYQLTPVPTPGPPPSAATAQQQQQMMPPPPPPSGAATHSENGPIPTPPWMTASYPPRAPASDHQSYMRASHPPSHARSSPQ